MEEEEEEEELVFREVKERKRKEGEEEVGVKVEDNESSHLRPAWEKREREMRTGVKRVNDVVEEKTKTKTFQRSRW